MGDYAQREWVEDCWSDTKSLKVHQWNDHGMTSMDTQFMLEFQHFGRAVFRGTLEGDSAADQLNRLIQMARTAPRTVAGWFPERDDPIRLIAIASDVYCKSVNSIVEAEDKAHGTDLKREFEMNPASDVKEALVLRVFFVSPEQNRMSVWTVSQSYHRGDANVLEWEDDFVVVDSSGNDESDVDGTTGVVMRHLSAWHQLGFGEVQS